MLIQVNRKRMYLARFQSWKVFKHSKAKDKKELCTRLLDDYQHGRELPILTASQLRKLQRHYKEAKDAGNADPAIESLLKALQGSSLLPIDLSRGRVEALVSNDSADENNDSPDSFSPHTSDSSSEDEIASNPVAHYDDATYEFRQHAIASQISRPNLSLAGKSKKIEEVLRLTQNYYQKNLGLYLRSPANAETDIDPSSMTALQLILDVSQKMLPTGHSELFELRRTYMRLLRR